MILVVPLLAYFALLVRSRDLPASVSWWRRNAYAVVLGLIASFPLLPTLFFETTVARGLTQVVDEKGSLVPFDWGSLPYAVDWCVALLACWLVLSPALQFIRSPKLSAEFDNCEPLTDGEVVRRVDSMSATLALPPPRLVQTRSEHGLLVNACAADGLLPTVIVGDGVLHSMNVEQRDAVLAHELGHLASHLGAWRILVAMVVAVTTVLVSGCVSMYVAGMWLVAANVLASVAFSHGAEFAADRRGAGIVGPDSMFAALATVDSASAGSPHTSPWLHALLSHPHLDERESRLLAGAASVAVRRNARVGARARVVLQSACLLLLVVSAVLGSLGWILIPVILGGFVAGAPTVAMLAAQSWEAIGDARRLGWRLFGPVQPVRLAFGVAGCVAVGLSATFREAAPALSLVGVAGLLAALLWGRRELRIRRQLRKHLGVHEWREWLQVYDAAPVRVRQRRDLWLKAMEVAHQLREYGRASAEHAGLLGRYPDYHFADLIRAAQIRSADPGEAVRMLRAVTERVPDSAQTLGALASALRVQGDFDAAWEAVQKAIALRRREDWLHAIACRIAIARGDLATAGQELQAAKVGGNVDLLTIIAEAHLAIAARRPDAAELVAACQARVELEPLRNNLEEAARLAEMLAEIRGSAEQEPDE